MQKRIATSRINTDIFKSSPHAHINSNTSEYIQSTISVSLSLYVYIRVYIYIYYFFGSKCMCQYIYIQICSYMSHHVSNYSKYCQMYIKSMPAGSQIPNISQQHPTYISNVKRLPNIHQSPKYPNTSENSEVHPKCQPPPGPPQTSKTYI